MAQYIIDLSGKAGLADNFSGDADMVTARPELRLDDGSGMASGLFNPYLRNGYLAPITTTAVSYTLDVATTTQLIATEFDYENEDVYWIDGIQSIYQATTLNDTALTMIDTLTNTTFTGKEIDALYDLQIYQMNGVRSLFYVGKGMTMNDKYSVNIATIPTLDSYITAGISIAPFASTKPAIVQSSRNAVVGAGTTNSHSITVPSGTNQALIVVAMWPSNAAAPSCTFASTSMSSEYTISTGPSMRVFKLANPDVTTGSVVVTWGSSVSSNVVYAFTVNNANQTEVCDANGARVLSPVVYDVPCYMPFVDINALNLCAAYCTVVMTDSDSNTSVIFDSTNTYGSDLLVTRSETGYGLQVGYTPLPMTTYSADEASWLTSVASGSFLQETTGDFAFMRNADNGFAYLFADNAVHKIDGSTVGGANGTVTRDVLLFPEYFRITDAIDYRSRLYIAIHQYPVTVQTTSTNNYTGKCGLYIWDRISSQLSSADYIELTGVREIKKIFASPEGLIKLITISDNGLTELRQFGYNDSGGAVFPVQKTLGIGAYPQVPDGLTTAGDKVIWIANDGNMYTEKNNAVTKLFQIKAQGTATAGLVTNIKTGAMLYGSSTETAGNAFRTNKQGISFSYLDSTTSYTKKIYPFDLTIGADTTQTPSQGDVYTGVKLIPIGSNVKGLRIYNAPITGTGTTVIATVKLYFNQSTTATTPSGMTKSITKDEAKRGYVDFKINSHNIHAVQVEVEWATAITLGEDMYLPSMAIVDYEETTSKSPDGE